MRKLSMVIFLWVLMSWFASVQADCDADFLAQNPGKILGCYLQEKELVPQLWELEHEEYDFINGVSIEKYTVTSQRWPKAGMMDGHDNEPLWQHKMILYRPDQIIKEQAMLIVAGGVRNSLEQNSDHRSLWDLTPQEWLLSLMASSTGTPIVVFKDVPNQCLSFEDHIPRKEDGIVAYTWRRFLDERQGGAYWPLQLPMTKAVVKAMDAVQEIVFSRAGVSIEHFVLTGRSKRGWATWLTALMDPRVNALIPQVIDILNTEKVLQHTYETYDHQWPEAYEDYVSQNIMDDMGTPAFDHLLQVIDPIAYLSGPDRETYRERLSLPQYILSASSDEFFVPDASALYSDLLPGETHLRIFPNQPHELDLTQSTFATYSFYNLFLAGTARPVFNWRFDDGVFEMKMDQLPSQVVVWEASNPKARDFRPETNIRYHSRHITHTGTCEEGGCEYWASVKQPKKGWKASFVEVTFVLPSGAIWTVTSAAQILGATAQLE